MGTPCGGGGWERGAQTHIYPLWQVNLSYLTATQLNVLQKVSEALCADLWKQRNHSSKLAARLLHPFNPITPKNLIDPINPMKPIDPIKPINPKLHFEGFGPSSLGIFRRSGPRAT